MANYINTRVRKTVNGNKWRVDCQEASTHDWDEALFYDEKHGQAQEKAVDAACKLDRDFSRECRQPVTAYDRLGKPMAVYLRGEPYKAE